MPGWNRWGREQICEVKTQASLKICRATPIINVRLWAHLGVVRVQLIAKQLGVRVADVSDAEEALQATGKTHAHLEV